MLPFALAIFTGAFLLFLGQPLVGKYILPWYGGGPGVWTTCLLFFQGVLLAGYAYAHGLTTWLSPRRQVMVHGVGLVLALCFLPISPGDQWRPIAGDDPVRSILLLLTATIGLPFIVLSATGPLLQRWFSLVYPGLSPYRLYALSNAGSLLALLAYPAVVEPRLTRAAQAGAWSIGLACFATACMACAVRVWRADGRLPGGKESGDGSVETGEEAGDGIFWVALPAIASVLLVSTTTRLCQDVAAMPLLWVLPLGIYLVTFIVSFDHAAWYVRGAFTALSAFGVVVTWQLFEAGNSAPLKLQLIGHLGTLFAACMVCHGELYRLKPPPRQLTAYFLFISAGGALGGFLVAVVAPAIFDDYRELQIGLWVLSYLLAVVCFRHRSRSLALGAAIGALALTFILPWLTTYYDGGDKLGTELMEFFTERKWYIVGAIVILVVCIFDLRRRVLLSEWQPRMAGFLMALSMALGMIFMIQWRETGAVQIINSSRNFYGTLKVYNYYPFDDLDNYHLLLHGATTHGLQFQNPERSMLATTYYPASSGIGMAINNLPTGPRRLGLVGLGTGTLAVYGRAGDHLTIYEINPAVETLARTYFTHIEKTPAKVDVVMGDARLTMERELAGGASPQYDLLALDAFSSDAIPVHLLTKEAFEIYLTQMKPGGVLAVHISNRYLDLRPVVEKLAEHFDMGVVSISDDNEPEWWIYATTWMLLSKNRAFLDQPVISEAAEEPLSDAKAMPLWTDDFTNLYSILK